VQDPGSHGQEEDIVEKAPSSVRAAPKFLFIDTNRTCNLRCQHCMYWKAKPDDAEGDISIERRDEIIREFAAMNGKGVVVICGGESMLDLDRYFAVTARCAESGLRCFSVINGTRVTTESMADRMMDEGPSEITVSLNSHRREVHDATRGVVGSFDIAVNALRMLLRSRSGRGCGPKIYAMAVICKQNYRDLDAFYDFVLNDIGADKLKLNFLQPTFGPPTPWYQDRFFSQNVIRNEEELARILQDCDGKYHLGINPVWLEQVKMYHRSVRKNGWMRLGWKRGKGTEEHICNSYERNIMVDLVGRVRLCFYPGFPSFQLSKPEDLRNFWESSDRLRERMRRCNRYCAISHSVRRESATLGRTELPGKG
jgi:MoaA/NifB/PqqE/SkfB family radical SAM enzyme